MGWLKQTFEDLSYIFSLGKGTWKRKIGTSLVALLLVYLAMDFHKLGDAPADWLTAHGLSIVNEVKIEPNVEELDSTESSSGIFAVRVSASGTTTPPVRDYGIEIRLIRTDLQDPEAEKAGRCGHKLWQSQRAQCVLTDGQGTWSMQEPLMIDELGSYRLEFSVKRWWGFRVVGSHSVPVKRVTRFTYLDPSTLAQPYLTDGKLPDSRRVQTGHRAPVSVFYLSQPNFDPVVFEELLLHLNLVLKSLELQVVDSDYEDEDLQNLPNKAEDYFPLLEKIADKEQEPEGLVVGITAKPLERNIFLQLSGRFLIISTADMAIFSTGSTPSVYKYLVTTIVAAGCIRAAHPFVPIDFHEDTRGCILDYARYKPRARIAVESGYLCAEHRRAYARTLSRDEYSDLTELLPLRWMK